MKTRYVVYGGKYDKWNELSSFDSQHEARQFIKNELEAYKKFAAYAPYYSYKIEKHYTF